MVPTDPHDAGAAEVAALEHEASLAADRARRRPLGAFYTPPALVAWILDRALPANAVHGVLDPACGTGHVLVAAARRVGVAGVFGSDLDADAVRIARERLAALDPSVPAEQIAEQVVVADGLLHWQGRRFDAVVGNPPFLGQLRRATGGRSGRHGLGAYTDTSAVFLHTCLELVVDGGHVALVQPLSVLAARDAGAVRAEVARRGAVVDFWCSPTPVFEDTDVLVCVPLVRVGAAGGPGPHGWGRLAAATFGVPEVDLGDAEGAGRAIADIATCTADFRDEYYGLAPFVQEAAGRRPSGDLAPLVTTGLIDPATCDWGVRTTRFARTGFAAPVVDVAALREDGTLAAWAQARLVPKLLVAGQGRVVEAVVDEHGAWLPSVPVLSVVPHDRADLWRLLALTLAPPLVAHAAAAYLGTGLSAGSVKLSAAQLAALPLPVEAEKWDDAARLARRVQAATGAERSRLLGEVGAAMTDAYLPGADERTRRALLDWWTARVERPARPPRA